MDKSQLERPVAVPITDHEQAKNENIVVSSKSSTPTMDHQETLSLPVSRFNWWTRVSVLTLFLLSGQAVATLLLRLYFNKGGNSKWLSTLVQLAGFPLLIPLLIFFPTPKTTLPKKNNSPSFFILASVYIFLGILLAGNSTLYSIGVANLPVSTFSLLSASELAFTAFFSYFLNAQKFTPFILNSLVLLTMSSTLLVFQNNDSQGSSTISKNKYAIGFVCSVCEAATAGLLLAVTQFAFRKIVKLTTLRVVLHLLIFQCFVASILILIGLFVSGEWKTLKGEMKGYELGKASYVMTLVGIAMALQVFNVGLIGLVFVVSSLFANVIGAFGLPIVPIFAVVFYHDKMSGVKVIAMLLALWGFASYIYQEYLDDSKAKMENNDVISEVPSSEAV